MNIICCRADPYRLISALNGKLQVMISFGKDEIERVKTLGKQIHKLLQIVNGWTIFFTVTYKIRIYN
jgi:hypothetical protein